MSTERPPVDHLARVLDDFIAAEITAHAAVTIAKGNR